MFILVCLLLNHSVFCQGRMGIGIKAGLSIPNLTSGNDQSPVTTGYGSRVDADFAVHAEIPLSTYFSVQAQLEYASQGGKRNGMQAFPLPADLQQLFPAGQAPAYLFADYKSEVRLNYLLLPLFLKMHIDIKKRWGAYVAAGSFASLLLDARITRRGESIIYLDQHRARPVSTQARSFSGKENIRGDLRKFNAGVSGYAGLQYKFRQGSIFLEAGGNFGFVDIQKDPTNGKNKTGAAVINLGYQFKL